MSELLLRSGEWERTTPESAGWRYLFFDVRRGSFMQRSDDAETVLVPLSGGCRVATGGETWELAGRDDVFAGLPWALYLPRDTAYEVTGGYVTEVPAPARAGAAKKGVTPEAEALAAFLLDKLS